MAVVIVLPGPEDGNRVPASVIARVAFAQAKDELGENASLRNLLQRRTEILTEYLGPEGAIHAELVAFEPDTELERRLRG